MLDCTNCGRGILNGDTIYYDGDGVICEDCRNNEYYLCDNCGALVHGDDRETADYGNIILCGDCIGDYYRCNHCDELFDYHNIAVDNNYTTLCDECYNNYYFTCEGCGEVYHLDDAYTHDDGYYCENCYNDIRIRLINSYNYKPDAIFYGGNATGYYGLEVEIDNGDDRDDAAGDIVDAGGDHVYLKDDGSLSYDGMEIVTHPATLEYHMNQFPWGAICDAALRYGYRSHDTSTCGLHIHVSRSAFGDTQLKRDLTIAKIMLLIDRWYNTKLVNFARRDLNKMQQWAAKPDAEIVEGDDESTAIYKSKKHDGHKYRAVNLCNYSTVEFRFFRGTLRRNTIIASIQFTDTLINYCKDTSLKNLFKTTWDDIFNNTGYKELNDYLKQRNLIEFKGGN